MLSLFCLPAHAQRPLSGSSLWLLGDWNGKRTELAQQGYEFDLGYTGELATKLDGGYNRSHGTRYADQFALGASLDLQKILGWQDTQAKITITKRNGQSLSNKNYGYIGDPRTGHLSATQEVWGRGQTWRLTDFWIQKQFLDKKLDIKLGRFGEGEDFNSFDCDFQNLSLCGSQVGNWVGDIWYNWPVSQWAGRIRYNFQPDWYAQLGIFEYNPENLDRSKGFNLSTDGSHGAIIPVEFIWQPKLSVRQLPGEYRAGYYHSTADSSQINHPAQTAHKHGGWLVVKQQLTSQADDNSRGLSGFANITVHDKKTNTVDHFQNVGLVYRGWLDARPKDEIALGLARIHVNDDVSRLQKDNDLLLNINDAAYQPIQGTEYNAEIYYGIHAADWLTIRPNIQYIKHAGGVGYIDETWVGGVKFQLAF
ncbi:carbohydrate porin [Alkanindiges sp. WGS2144]|uniref:carbohydrate porin n=1 Tax=Alkanindiges sp. WGS2144 TaxID=3366808 RepID=UPI0037524F0F